MGIITWHEQVHVAPNLLFCSFDHKSQALNKLGVQRQPLLVIMKIKDTTAAISLCIILGMYIWCLKLCLFCILDVYIKGNVAIWHDVSIPNMPSQHKNLTRPTMSDMSVSARVEPTDTEVISPVDINC